ncbi:hypothetical protein V6N13_088768 [Hibiscus sabdariffa]|uniref:Uncharacterized protein n=1 Tax=Hibiscus sabdariffa TaxID=183260 RepID=A0ABR2G0C5_9ROSI
MDMGITHVIQSDFREVVVDDDDQTVTAKLSYATAVAGKDVVFTDTRSRRFKRLDGVVPRSLESAKAVAGTRFSVLNELDGEVRDRFEGELASGGYPHATGIRNGSHSTIVIIEDSGVGNGHSKASGKTGGSKKSQGAGVRKGLSVKKKTEFRFPSPHVLSEWVQSVPNSSDSRAANLQRCPTVIDPGETVDKVMEGMDHRPLTNAESVVMSVDKENVALRQ